MQQRTNLLRVPTPLSCPIPADKHFRGRPTQVREEEDDGDNKASSSGRRDIFRRWVRIARCAVCVAGAVGGFIWNEGTREWSVQGKLAQKVKRWKKEDEIEREADERRRMGRRWADCPMDIDNDTADDSLFEESDNEGGSEEIKTLKVCTHPVLHQIFYLTLHCRNVDTSNNSYSLLSYVISRNDTTANSLTQTFHVADSLRFREPLAANRRHFLKQTAQGDHSIIRHSTNHTIVFRSAA
jgi:hypothetical protein